MAINNIQSNYAFIIPAYNPSDSLINLIYNLSNKTSSLVLIINDGSSNSYCSIFRKIELISKENNRVFILQYTVNKGKGAALKTAFEYILVNFPQIAGVITLDADGQHTVNDSISVLNILQKYPNSFILGYRKFTKNIPLRSFVGNQMSIYLYYLILGKKFKDTQTGLRGLSKNLMIISLSFKSNRFEFETEQLAKAIQLEAHGSRIIEIPIKTVYMDRNNSSSFRPLLDSFLIYRTLIRVFYGNIFYWRNS